MALVSALVLTAVTPALAQSPPTDRVAVSLTGGYLLTERTFSQSVTFEEYSEEGSLTTAYTVTRHPTADAGVTVRLWRHFGLGLAGSYLHESGSAQVTALLPHPFQFGQPRQISGPAGAAHNELAVHFQAAYWAQLGPRLAVIVSGGPSVFTVDQDFVADVAFSATEPYDTATYDGATVLRQRQTATGGNIGGDVGWRLTRHLAVAGALRYARATATFPESGAGPVSVGGVHAGAGLQLLF